MFKLIKKLLNISIYFWLIVFVLKLEKDMNEVKQMNENALKQLKQMELIDLFKLYLNQSLQ